MDKWIVVVVFDPCYGMDSEYVGVFSDEDSAWEWVDKNIQTCRDEAGGMEVNMEVRAVTPYTTKKDERWLRFLTIGHQK